MDQICPSIHSIGQMFFVYERCRGIVVLMIVSAIRRHAQRACKHTCHSIVSALSGMSCDRRHMLFVT